MRIARNIIALLIMALTMQGCQASHIKHEPNIEQTDTWEELIFKGQISIPLPKSYKKILFDENAMIIVSPEYSVVYRWIDQKEVEFIGSDKSPYNFFKAVFKNPTSDKEKKFLEGLKNEVHQPKSTSDLEFYYFDNGSGPQMYILSSSLSFVVEVTYKGEGEKYINTVVTHSKIK